MLDHRLPEVVFRGAFDEAGIQLALARKDIGLATELAREYSVPTTVVSLVEQAMMECLVRGWGAKDSSAPWLLQEGRAGVAVRRRPTAPASA